MSESMSNVGILSMSHDNHMSESLFNVGILSMSHDNHMSESWFNVGILSMSHDNHMLVFYYFLWLDFNSSSIDRNDDERGNHITPHHGNHRDVSSRSSGGDVSQESAGVSQAVSQLRVGGYEEELQWLEAYLLDEARDRTVDGEKENNIEFH